MGPLGPGLGIIEVAIEVTPDVPVKTLLVKARRFRELEAATLIARVGRVAEARPLHPSNRGVPRRRPNIHRFHRRIGTAEPDQRMVKVAGGASESLVSLYPYYVCGLLHALKRAWVLYWWWRPVRAPMYVRLDESDGSRMRKLKDEKRVALGFGTG